MPALRTLLPIASLLAATFVTAGCYDLSDPSGPHPDDFMRDRTGRTSEAEPREGKTASEARCATAPCEAVDGTISLVEPATAARAPREDDSEPTADERDAELRRKAHPVPLDAP